MPGSLPIIPVDVPPAHETLIITERQDSTIHRPQRRSMPCLRSCISSMPAAASFVSLLPPPSPSAPLCRLSAHPHMGYATDSPSRAAVRAFDFFRGILHGDFHLAVLSQYALLSLMQSPSVTLMPPVPHPSSICVRIGHADARIYDLTMVDRLADGILSMSAGIAARTVSSVSRAM